MEALVQGIATSARERKMAAGDGKAQTASMLQAFGRARAAMAKALKFDLAADGAGRSVNVCTIRANTGTMREEFRQDHVRMRRDLRWRLAQSTEAVATFVVSLCADFAKGRADFTKAHRHMTKAHRAELAKDRRDRSREVAELMNDFHVSRGAMAQELTESLQKFAQRVQFQVSSLREGFRNSLREVREDVQAAHRVWNFLLLGQAGVAAQTAIPASLRHHRPAGGFEMGEAEEKVTVGEAVRRFVTKRGKPKR